MHNKRGLPKTDRRTGAALAPPKVSGTLDSIARCSSVEQKRLRGEAPAMYLGSCITRTFSTKSKVGRNVTAPTPCHTWVEKVKLTTVSAKCLKERSTNQPLIQLGAV